MTRLEQGTQRANFEEADLSELVEIQCAEQPALPHRITMQTDVQPDVTAWFDVTLMSRLLQNLISNAGRYSRPGGHIWVTLRREDGEIMLSVRDDGIGIPERQLDQIWQRFYQVDPPVGTDGAPASGSQWCVKLPGSTAVPSQSRAPRGWGAALLCDFP
mgnify:CR=1 FL=1